MINFGLPKPIYARLCKYMHNVKLDHSIETGAKQKDNFTGEHVGLLQLAPILEFSGYKNRCLRGFPSSPWSSCCTSFVYCRTGRILIKVDLLRMFFCTPAEPRWDSNCNYSQVSRFVCREDPLTPLQKSGQPVKHAPAVASTVPPPGLTDCEVCTPANTEVSSFNAPLSVSMRAVCWTFISDWIPFIVFASLWSFEWASSDPGIWVINSLLISTPPTATLCCPCSAWRIAPVPSYT